VKASVTVDLAGAQMGGAARFATELRAYLARTGRADIRLIGMARRVDPRWLIRRETIRFAHKRIALNNVTFITPGGERWTLLRNALHFLSDMEASQLDPSLLASLRREAAVVRRCARLADLLVAPSTAMAERITKILPSVGSRIVVRPHPVSADPAPADRCKLAILCPVLLASYKRMDERLAEFLAALTEYDDKSVRLHVTARPEDLPPSVSSDPRIEFLGHLDHHELRQVRVSSQAIYFPTGLESFGYPLAEARVSGQPVIACDTAQNREIAGAALCGFSPGDRSSLANAIKHALTMQVAPDPKPFDPDAYFDWLLGDSK
jgi:glycosyltransferase involved in cell wall biosynthesis